MENSLTGICIITVCNIRSLFDTILSRKHKGYFHCWLHCFQNDNSIGGGADKAKQSPKIIFKQWMMHRFQNEDVTVMILYGQSINKDQINCFLKVQELEKNILI